VTAIAKLFQEEVVQKVMEATADKQKPVATLAADTAKAIYDNVFDIFFSKIFGVQTSY